MKKLLSFIGLLAVIISNPVFAAINAPSSLIGSTGTKYGTYPNYTSADINFSWNDNSNNETSFYAEYSVTNDGTYTTWNSLGSVPANTTGGTLNQPWAANGQCKTWRKYRIKAVNATESSSWTYSNQVFLGGTVNCM
ncbi:hypothetical protein KBC86_02600 [Candidatus Gracilibacteria bacterium]|nr:hypothetical protein [Candidatus Gracilibacteria bacterium]